MENRPRGRQQHITGQGKNVFRRGSGLGSGPVGNSQGYSGRGQSSSQGSRPQQINSTRRTSGSSGGTRSFGGSKLLIAILAAVVLFGGGGLGFCSGGHSNDGAHYQSNYVQQQSSDVGLSGGLGSLFGNFLGSNTSTGWSRTANTGTLDTSVSSLARNKRTNILGNGRDTVTVMVYMCGADLESRSGSATADLQEMAEADLGSKVNLLVYTGGAKQWNNNVVSSRTNQIYKVENGGLKRLVSDAGNVSMTNPSTLASFIQYCRSNYSASRYDLILWDHGSGSIAGYGYDEKFSKTGSMTLKGINEALTAGGVNFDFIGFDTCLMGTVENALMLTAHADYLIASEETEPGLGWYYTNWLSKLSANTSMPTIQIGKLIVDDFVSTCARQCYGQKATLSVIDLAELERTVPAEFSDFASSTLDLLESNNYQTVSNARSSARSFATSNKVDQVDLVSLADKLGTKEAADLAEAILGAVKYNGTSRNMTDAYGLSIYFPYQKMSTVNSAVQAYEDLGLDDEYAECIRRFASIETGGQAVSGGSANPLSSLFGSLGGSSSGSSSNPLSSLFGSYTGGGSNANGSSSMISQILGGLLGGGTGGVSGLTGSNSSFLRQGLDLESDTEYYANNYFDPTALVWRSGSDGTPVMYLSEKQWSLVQDLELNVFIDDGEGFIDLGLDNIFNFTDDGGLIGEYGGTWLAIDGQPVAYYHMDTVDDGKNYSITGRVPAMLNGVRVDLILVFDDDEPYGYIAGAMPVYDEEETATVAKTMLQLEDGDVIDFLCDYYAYDGTYLDSYYLGEQYVVNGTPEISDVYIDSYAASATYRFTDIYHQYYWSPVM